MLEVGTFLSDFKHNIGLGMNMKSAFHHIVDRNTAGMRSNVPLSKAVLKRQNLDFRGTGGISQGNSSHGFLPAFIDQITEEYYLSHFADGRIAPVHVLDGLPEHLVAKRKKIFSLFLNTLFLGIDCSKFRKRPA